MHLNFVKCTAFTGDKTVFDPVQIKSSLLVSAQSQKKIAW
jgi:hypothetical protein